MGLALLTMEMQLAVGWSVTAVLQGMALPHKRVWERKEESCTQQRGYGVREPEAER